MKISRRFFLANGLGSIPIAAGNVSNAKYSSPRSLKITSPIETGKVSVDSQGCVAYPDTVVSASKSFVFIGTYTGEFKNIMIAVPGVKLWGSTTQDGKGGWTAIMDLSGVRTGPLNCRIMAWYDDLIERVIHLDFTLLIDNPFVPFAKPQVPTLANKMKHLFTDDFEKLPDDSRWAFGVRPDGTQWGSGSHFMTNEEKLSDVFQLPMPSCLRIRAIYDDSYIDPEKWGRKWRSGLLCTAFSDGRSPVASFRKGYVEMRAILPLGKGMWPSMWGVSLGAGGKDGASNVLEIDGFEAYCEQADPGEYFIANNVIVWLEGGKSDGVNRQVFTKKFDATSDWRTYGVQVEDNQAIFYIDHIETHRIDIPGASSKLPLYWMFDNALSSGDWPIVVPPAGYVDMWIDYISIYSDD